MKVKKSWLRATYGSRIAAWEQRADRLGLISDTIIDQDLDDIIEYWGGCCAYCGGELTNDMHFDHAVPLSAKFAEEYHDLNTVANIVPACQRCNLVKSNKSFEDFAIRDVQTRIENWYIMQMY